MSDTINYGNLMHNAMRSLIQEVLEGVRKNGLPGEHHFFITFDTQHPDADLAEWLKERYPEEMTVVIQHWFADLDVTDVGFTITLNFGDQPVTMYVPYDAIKTFVDPSVEFGLRFETQDEDGNNDVEATIASIDTGNSGDTGEKTDVAKETSPDDTSKSKDKKDADVVSLDSFRK